VDLLKLDADLLVVRRMHVNLNGVSVIIDAKSAM